MSLPDGSHVHIGNTAFLLDEGYEQLTGRRCYIHNGQTAFAGRTDISGKPGSQNLKQDYIVQSFTRFDGEGQVVLDNADDTSPFRFYRSEGLNARVAGQLSLNKSILSETVSTTSSTVTKEGNANFADISGTASTTSGTDRRLTAINTKVGTSSNFTPASNINAQVNYYLYYEDFSTYATTIQGSAFNKVDGSPQTSGTDMILTRGDSVWSAKLSSGSELTAGTPTRIELYASLTSIRGAFVRFQIVDVTSSGGGGLGLQFLPTVVAGGVFDLSTSSGTPFAALTFTPETNRDYRVKVSIPASTEPTPVQTTLDKILYGAELTSDTATVEIWNQDTSSVLATQTVQVTSSAAGNKVASIAAQLANGVNYRARVTRTSGKQAIWVDKVEFVTLTGETWTIDCMDLGLGSQTAGVFTPKVWAAAHGTASDDILFAYNTSTDVWDSTATLNDAATTATFTVRAMAHSDAAEYALLSNGTVYSTTAAGVDTRRATNISGPVGMAVAQDRLWVLDESSSGTTVYAIPLENTVGDITTSVDARHVVINSAAKTPDTSLRQRMCGSPTGSRFFINYGDVTCKVYEVDGSGTTLQPRELADLGAGVKGTCITHVGGITFVGAQFLGDSTASDTDKKPRACLFAIDQNGVLNLVEFFREDSPDVRPPQALFAYQTDLYVLQGNYIWRHDLRGGGLYLEYELAPQTPGNQRSMAVLFGRIFAAYTTEIFVAGSVGTYRQSSVANGSAYISSISDFGLPVTKKALTKLEVLTDNMPSNTSVAVEYQTDQNGTWTLAGEMNSGSRQTFYITNTSFLTLQLRATLKTKDGVHTPVLHGVTVWATSAEDEESFDLVLYTQDAVPDFRIADEQDRGVDKSTAIFQYWRNKTVIPFVDGYGSTFASGEEYLVTIEDIRVEQNIEGEGRTVTTLKVIR